MGVRFFRRGKTRVFFLPTVANLAAPTAAEFSGGTELTDDIADITGFATTLDQIGTPDLGSNFTGNVPGEVKAADSSLKIYLDSEDNPLRATLAEGTVGNIGFIDFKPSGSIAADDVVDVYPVIVGGTPKERDMGSTAAQWEMQATLTSEPSVDVTVV